MTTTNQTKVFCNTNQYWLAYRNREENRELNKYDITDHGWITNADTYRANVAYRRAHNELKEYLDTPKARTGLTHYIFHFNFLEKINYTVSAKMEIDGTWYLNIYSNGIDGIYYNEIIFIGETEHIFEYNGIIDIEHFKQAAINEIEKHLFPKGRFRDFQLSYGYTKAKIIDIYRSGIEKKLYVFNSEFDPDDIFIYSKWIQKHFNIDIDDVPFEEAVIAVNKIGKCDKLTHLAYYDASWFNYFDGDIDDLEREFYEHEDEYKENTVFINTTY